MIQDNHHSFHCLWYPQNSITAVPTLPSFSSIWHWSPPMVLALRHHQLVGLQTHLHNIHQHHLEHVKLS